MSDDMTRKIFEAQKGQNEAADRLKEFHDQFKPLADQFKGLREYAGVFRLLAEAERGQNMMRAALGPMEDLRRMNLATTTPSWAAAIKHAKLQIPNLTEHFTLPKIAEIAPLLKRFEVSEFASAIRQYEAHGVQIQHAVEAMRTPWLNVQDSIRSIAAFVDLQGMGLELKRFSSFDPTLVNTLRANLGDWREPFTLPDAIFDDIETRTAFYVGRGLDPSLTALPTIAFEQSLSIAGLDDAPTALIESYARETNERLSDEECGFQRTNAAHDRLLRFETAMRRFIDERMTATFGEEWTKHKLPGPIFQKWREKKKYAQDNKEPEWPLIAYADFTDYVTIIVQRDCWEAIFKPIFQRREFVTESFHRLHPIRLCTMHARIITHDDELYLRVETKRLLEAIGIHA